MNLENFKKLSAEKQEQVYLNLKKEQVEFDKKMINRVSHDCKINTSLWLYQLSKLRELYNDNEEQVKSLIRFLMTKGKVYKMHQDNPLTLDIEQCKKNLDLFDEMIKVRVDKLKEVMPKIPRFTIKTKPKNPYKKDGSLSVEGEKWKIITEGCNLPFDYRDEIKVLKEYEEPNPQSVTQVKEWLFGLGWTPEIYVESPNTKGEINKVPQLKDKEKNLCPSIVRMAEEVPEIRELTDLSLLQHRRGYFVGFLRDRIRGNKIVADIGGFTNTLRIKHRTLVNLIKPSAPYGEYVRSLLLPPQGMIMIGSDVGALESVTRNNFVFDIDRAFVDAQSHLHYDPHLEICEIAGMMTSSETFFYKWWKAKRKKPELEFEEIGDIPKDFQLILDTYKTDEQKQEFHDKLDKRRQSGKTTNYSAMYKVGKAKLSKELKISQNEAQKLLDAYWIKNNCVKVFSESCEVKTVGKQMWVKNPLNNYWYSLRNEKDIFSVINQSAGDYIFTLWQHNLMRSGVKLFGGWHDEIVTCCNSEDRDIIIEKLKSAMELVNKQVKMKVIVGIDYKIGENYAKVH